MALTKSAPTAAIQRVYIDHADIIKMPSVRVATKLGLAGWWGCVAKNIADARDASNRPLTSPLKWRPKMTSTPENPENWLSSAHRWSQCFYSAYYEKDAPPRRAGRWSIMRAADALRDIYPDATVVTKDAEGEVDADGVILIGEYIDRVADMISFERHGWTYTGAEVESELAKMPVRGSADLVLLFKNVGQTAALHRRFKDGRTGRAERAACASTGVDTLPSPGRHGRMDGGRLSHHRGHPLLRRHGCA